MSESADTDWEDEDPGPGFDIERVRRRAAELGPNFKTLVDAVTSEMRIEPALREDILVSLTNLCDRFITSEIDQPAVRKWLQEVQESATTLADLLARGAPFPEGSPGSEFSFVHDSFSLPNSSDVVLLRRMAEVANIAKASWVKPGARRQYRRDELIGALADMYERFTPNVPNGARPFLTVVELILRFLSDHYRTEATLVRLIQRVLKKRAEAR